MLMISKKEHPMSLNIVLCEPQIPQNTGNISRTCAVTGTRLHLIKPYGFELSERTVRRAGLDYWPKLDLREYDTPEQFFQQNPGATIWYFSTKGARNYAQARYKPGDYLMFGRETAGLPEELLERNYANVVRIPMQDWARSLNLSNTVALALYEALRQNGFEGLEEQGTLTK